jgi:hypothetical protein
LRYSGRPYLTMAKYTSEHRDRREELANVALSSMKRIRAKGHATEVLQGKGYTYRYGLESFFHLFIRMYIDYGYEGVCEDGGVNAQCKSIAKSQSPRDK